MTAKVSCFAQELWAFQAASFFSLLIYRYLCFLIIMCIVFFVSALTIIAVITIHRLQDTNLCGKIFSMHTKKLSLLSVGNVVSLRYNLMNVLDGRNKWEEGRRQISTNNDNNVKAGAKLYVSFI